MKFKDYSAFALLLLISPSVAFAVGSTGFENASFSTISMSQANAVVAQSEEPAAISYNPAAIADLKGIQFEANSTFISLLTVGHSAQNGKRMQSTGTVIPVPTAYASINPGKILNDRIAIGIGMDSPFGLLTQYPSSYPGTHYSGYVNQIKMYTIKPVMAFKVFDWLLLGAGPIYYRTYDLGGVQAYPNLVRGGTTDGQVRLNLAGNTWGWQMGALIKPHKKHALGFYFRSPVNMLVKGLGKVENATTGGMPYFETGVHSKFNLPLNLTFGYAFSPNKKTTIEADFGYTRWSIHKRLYFNADPVNANDDIIMKAIGQGSGNDKDYEDTFSIHLGGKHRLNKKFILRGGTFLYTAAISKNHWTPAVPDGTRIGWAIGASYEAFKNFNIDTCYSFQLGLRRSINNDITEALGTTVDGRYMSFFNIFTVTLRYAWEGVFDKKPENAIENNPAYSNSHN